jgi:hypothetical protein
MNFPRDFAPAPFDKVPLVMSASWLVLSAGLLLLPSQIVLTISRGSVKLPNSAVWACRVLGAINLVGSIHFIIFFWR